MFPLRIITCPEWGARPPRDRLILCGPAHRIIFHHTAGHHPEISNPTDESYEEARRYALAIQAQHIAQGWADSGHNFLVCRNGMIFQGRWLTVSAIEARHMVLSAHCPGQNDQVGIEHEHYGSEPMTAKQHEASSWLQAWIAKRYGHDYILPVDPHFRWFPTACPANLSHQIDSIRGRALEILRGGIR